MLNIEFNLAMFKCKFVIEWANELMNVNMCLKENKLNDWSYEFIINQRINECNCLILKQVEL